MLSVSIYDIVPMAAPRMTQADRWRERAVVLRYRAFKDEVRAKGLVLENGNGVTFVLPMPQSWSKHKKAAMDGQGCTTKPDLDNLLKALMDALYQNDAHLWRFSRLEKIWGYEGSIKIDRYKH